MKTIKYRKYWYGGDFSMKEEALPDDIRIYNVDWWHSGAKVKDKDIYTEGYVFKSEEKFEDSILIGDAWYRFEERIYIEDFPVEPIENCVPPKDCYIVFEQYNLNSDFPISFTQWMDALKVLKCEELDKFHKSCKEIGSIAKIRRFTKKGIETTTIGMKSMNSRDIQDVSIHTFGYGHGFGESYSGLGRDFFTTEEKYKQLFDDKLEEYYKLFKE